ncbi:MAG: helix-turn-helix domain-containing protein, partial [Blautia sp.]|nr:helix-turn-helix domain-containing protein [Blautia sp.]
LREDGANVTEIALACGFNNISNFYRLYKKHMGKTPGYEKSKNN